MLTWLKRIVGGADKLPPTPLPTVPAAPYRFEESTSDGCTIRRVYNCHAAPEWLAEQTETGLDEAGHPWHRRTWYFPWGAKRRQRTKRVSSSLLLCYFANGELRLRRHAKAGYPTHYYCAEPLVEGVYTEQMPQYPGGDNALFVRDIQRAFKYPAQALRNQEEGRVNVSFVVSSAGLITNVHILESVSPSIDEAALQAVITVGQRRWVPGLQNRQAVSVSFTVPITCRLL